jgi:hypothetical protein
MNENNNGETLPVWTPPTTTELAMMAIQQNPKAKPNEAAIKQAMQWHLLAFNEKFSIRAMDTSDIYTRYEVLEPLETRCANIKEWLFCDDEEQWGKIVVGWKCHKNISGDLKKHLRKHGFEITTSRGVINMIERWWKANPCVCEHSFDDWKRQMERGPNNYFLRFDLFSTVLFWEKERVKALSAARQNRFESKNS